MSETNDELATTGGELETTEQSALTPPASTLPTAEAVRVANTKMKPEQVEILCRALELAEKEKCPSFGKLGELLRIDGSTISRLMNGKYGAQPDSILLKIEQSLRVYALKAVMGGVPIVPTSVMRKIEAMCELTRAAGSIAAIFGDKPTGKTVSLEQYAATHKESHYVRMPSKGQAGIFLADLARTLGAPDRLSYAEARRAVFERLGATSLVLVDDVHQAIYGRVNVDTFALIYEIHEQTHCGVVLCGREALPVVTRDERLRGLAQIVDHVVTRLQVPVQPSKDDLGLIRKAYGFPELTPKSEEMKAAVEMARAHGIGKLCTTLRMAAGLARSQRTTPTWEHFLVTVATCDTAAHGKWLED